jgi:hypothetical protein
MSGQEARQEGQKQEAVEKLGRGKIEDKENGRLGSVKGQGKVHSVLLFYFHLDNKQICPL